MQMSKVLHDNKAAVGLIDNQKDTGSIDIGRKFNTDVLLLDLDQLRQVGWTDMCQNVTKTATSVTRNALLTDDDVINEVLGHHSDLVYHLPCNWNLQVFGNNHAELCDR